MAIVEITHPRIDGADLIYSYKLIDGSSRPVGERPRCLSTGSVPVAVSGAASTVSASVSEVRHPSMPTAWFSKCDMQREDRIGFRRIGKFVVTASGDEVAFIVYGACTTLPKSISRSPAFARLISKAAVRTGAAF